ncbi:hypothetical protein DAEQUDRAFT_660058 [Daedalea quercina L-15889]|uniref:KOW domain-containing protein n=1 Tax=Daedalea quercina L-15889 TaxID=1314783 RepID=A0A165U617_9APHY|nr:hypothetical protein DAEQUDRAFT_660058 [Daedalea quercina L-15889]
MPPGWSKVQAARAWTSSPLTKDFRHLLSLPAYWMKRKSSLESAVRFVKTKDRIKYWNIVPGDQVRLRNDRSGRIYQVNLINRLSNRVMVKMEMDSDREGTPSSNNKSVPYSNCQLFIGRYEFPPQGDSTEAQTKPVFALRIGTDNHAWIGYCHAWDRYATATTPRLPHYMPGEPVRIHVPWPKLDKRSPPDVGPLDTVEDVVMQVTYTPPTFPVFTGLADPQPKAPSEQEYITAAHKGDAASYDASQVFEVFLAKELANPHSRAKKQARWKSHKLYERSLLQKFIKTELENLDGRTHRDARAEAAWKWRHALAEERKAVVKRRWQNRGGEARLLRKKTRRVRKEGKRRERLRNLVLEEGPNQIVPRSTEARA